LGIGNCTTFAGELGTWQRGPENYAAAVFQIVFNEISAAEISRLDTLEQLDLFDEFKVGGSDLDSLDGERFGRMERDGKTLYRFRTKDWRVYFEVKEEAVIVHRVLHKGTFSDFVFRSNIPLAEDEELAKSKHFWKLIDEGRAARRV
jgi:hypothetical protein